MHPNNKSNESILGITKNLLKKNFLIIIFTFIDSFKITSNLPFLIKLQNTREPATLHLSPMFKKSESDDMRFISKPDT